MENSQDQIVTYGPRFPAFIDVLVDNAVEFLFHQMLWNFVPFPDKSFSKAFAIFERHLVYQNALFLFMLF